jgi:hypothetical protein
MEPHEITALVGKLRKRGFITDGHREHCEACGQSGVSIFRLVGRTGGRDIHWCMACGKQRSFRRSSADQLVEDADFDLAAFLA